MAIVSAPDALTTTVRVATGLAAVATLMGLLVRLGWLCELACHFRLQYAWILLLSAAFFLTTGKFSEAALAVAFMLVNLALIMPVYVRRTQWANGGTLRVLSANVQWSNRSYERLRRVIRSLDPDLIMLVEVTTEWTFALNDLQAAYPFSKSVLCQNGFGIALYSRVPFERAEIAYLGRVKLPSVVARIRFQEQRLTVIGTQPVSPTSPYRAKRRNRQLAALAEFARLQGGPLMILGDLNTTSWSPVFQNFLRTTQLRDSRAGFGLQPTWPAAVALLRIPIDHCMVSSEIVVQQRRIGPSFGSDHLPVIVDVSVG